jgi:hypothetical protein
VYLLEFIFVVPLKSSKLPNHLALHQVVGSERIVLLDLKLREFELIKGIYYKTPVILKNRH